MASKEKFFDELYALDDTDLGPLDDGIISSMAALPCKRRLESGSSLTSERESSAKRVRTVKRAASDLTQPSDRGTDAVRVSLSRSTTAPAATLLPDDLSDGGKHMPATRSRTIATRGGTKARGEANDNITSPVLLFSGLLFYFFPDNDKNPSRKLRIKKALEHGAIWQRVWSDKVTHVIVDRSMNYKQVLKHLKIDGIPTGIVVVKEDYVAECLDYRSLVDPMQAKHRVKDHELPDPSPVLDKPMKDPMELKPAKKDVQAAQPQTLSQRTVTTDVSDPSPAKNPDPGPAKSASSLPTVHNDELESVINEAKTLQHLPLDHDEADSRPTSAGGETETGTAQQIVPKWQAGFQCMKSNTVATKDDNPNAPTMDLLQEMATHYDQIKDTWRPIAYRKAINTLSKQQKKICTREEAERLPNIGSRLAAKIEEIVYTNHLQRLESARAEPTDKILQLFLGVHGIGYGQGMKYVAQGWKSLEDLRTDADLTEVQKIGLSRYKDFNTRIPRAEVKQHGDYVATQAKKLDPEITVYTMGSYRRGAETSSDIDLVITHPEWRVSQLRIMLLDRLIPRLYKQDFLKCTLADTNRIDGSKWLGASCLPGSTIWRRMDFLLVPAAELGAALIYFTGNDIFNRSMRLLASRKGMRLNQRGLYKDVMRGKGREKLTEGELVEGRDEKGIFAALGVPWREPWERIC